LARKFSFSSTLCHYAGEKETRYRNAIRNEASPQNIEVKTVSVEKAKGDDLLADQPYTTHLRWKKRNHAWLPLQNLHEAEVQRSGRDAEASLHQTVPTRPAAICTWSATR
jgi:hypothetical protein